MRFAVSLGTTFCRIAFVAIVVLVGASAFAHADTITIGSYAGSSQSTMFDNSATSYDATNSGTPGAGTGAGSYAYWNDNYVAPYSGTTFLSFSSSGDGGAGYTLYTTTFSLSPLETYSGVLYYMADNSVGITLNGVEIVSNASLSNGGFNGWNSVALTSSMFESGTNTLVFDVYNANDTYNPQNPTAVDYYTSLTGTAVTAEPSSAVLLGTGLLGTTGLVWRRRERWRKQDVG